MKTHTYTSHFEWTGNIGKGTQNYTSYERDFLIKILGKPNIKGSSEPSFRGDATKHNPEDLFLSSISSCHALWYLHLCASNAIEVLSYEDAAQGKMQENEDGRGHFTAVYLKPQVLIKSTANIDLAHDLHNKAHEMCFIANSCNFPIHHQAKIAAKYS